MRLRRAQGFGGGGGGGGPKIKGLYPKIKKGPKYLRV